ncbi:MAG: hypothetical protein H0X13_08515 [Ramlibacter sp.]|nr:hypothetical protein [Ramlibacter sp.]
MTLRPTVRTAGVQRVSPLNWQHACSVYVEHASTAERAYALVRMDNLERMLEQLMVATGEYGDDGLPASLLQVLRQCASNSIWTW